MTKLRRLSGFLFLGKLFCTGAFVPPPSRRPQRLSLLRQSDSDTSNNLALGHDSAVTNTCYHDGHKIPSFLFGLGLAFSIAVAPASAATVADVFNHEYSDPFHPLCERRIEVSKDGKTFHYSGTAVGPKDDPVRRGCSEAEIKEFGLRKGAFDGFILDSGARISAGDGIHEGVWEPANSASTNLGYENVDGIRWNDGNKWVVKK